MLHFDAKCNSHIGSAKMTESCKVLRHNDLGKKKNIFGFGTEDAFI
jgi:hypothetical protein